MVTINDLKMWGRRKGYQASVSDYHPTFTPSKSKLFVDFRKEEVSIVLGLESASIEYEILAHIHSRQDEARYHDLHEEVLKDIQDLKETFNIE